MEAGLSAAGWRRCFFAKARKISGLSRWGVLTIGGLSAVRVSSLFA
jgi:hypothetical protein